MKKTGLIILLLLSFLFLKAQDEGMLKYGLTGSAGYAFGKHTGLGLGLGVELEYNLTKKVPVGIFARFDMYGLRPIGSGGFRISYVIDFAPDQYIELKANLGGSVILEKNDVSMGLMTAFSPVYKKYFSGDTYFYIGPAFNAIFDGVDKLNNMQFVTIEGGFGFFLY